MGKAVHICYGCPSDCKHNLACVKPASHVDTEHDKEHIAFDNHDNAHSWFSESVCRIKQED